MFRLRSKISTQKSVVVDHYKMSKLLVITEGCNSRNLEFRCCYPCKTKKTTFISSMEYNNINSEN